MICVVRCMECGGVCCGACEICTRYTDTCNPFLRLLEGTPVFVCCVVLCVVWCLVMCDVQCRAVDSLVCCVRDTGVFMWMWCVVCSVMWCVV